MSETLRYLSNTIDNEELARELRLRACSAMAANAGVYRQLLETSDFDARLQALEDASQARNGHVVT